MGRNYKLKTKRHIPRRRPKENKENKSINNRPAVTMRYPAGRTLTAHTTSIATSARNSVTSAACVMGIRIK